MSESFFGDSSQGGGEAELHMALDYLSKDISKLDNKKNIRVPSRTGEKAKGLTVHCTVTTMNTHHLGNGLAEPKSDSS
ncbi:hypothetical protein VNO77_25086 [Canavalia gladiata]|uniref:Uncharacterized protein n=1 Tax=Canavalia gladiata TaxID=3824 RepID=A0AAN9L7H0_CANGL